MEMNLTMVTDVDEMFQGRFQVCCNPGKELVGRKGKTEGKWHINKQCLFLIYAKTYGKCCYAQKKPD